MITKFDSLFAGHTDMENCGYQGTPVNERLYDNRHLATSLFKAEAMAQMMDRNGYDTFWMAEHHFQREGTECIPNVVMMALHLAHRTTKLRLGCGFNIAPMWHPLRLAEDYAVADILTGGRITFGLGRGYHTREVETFGSPLMDQAANRELFEEQVEIIFKAFHNDSFSHKGKHYTLPARVPYRGYQLEDMTLVPRPFSQPVECWQPIQGGTMRAFEFMAKYGISGLLGGGSSEGGAMHQMIVDFQTAYRQVRGMELKLGERLAIGYHFMIAETREKAMEMVAKYYEENMKMFGELRLVKALTDAQIEAMRDPKKAKGVKLPSIADAEATGGFLCGPADLIIEKLKVIEKKYPGLERVNMSMPVGVPLNMWLDQHERFAKEVMPAFKGKTA